MANGERPTKLPPQDLEAERALLGGMLIDPPVIDDIAPKLGPSHFYADPNRRICEVIYYLRDQNKPIDAVTVGHELQRREWIADVGGLPYLAQLMDSVPHSGHSAYYAGIIRGCWQRRTIIDSCTDTLRDAYAAGSDPADVVARHDAATQKLLETTVSSSEVKPVSQILFDIFDRRVSEEDGTAIRHEAVPTGFAKLDDISGGLRATQVVILAGRASMGKTALGLDIARSVSHTGAPVLFFSLEMSALDIGERMMSMESGVSGYKIRKGELGVLDHQAIGDACERLGALPLHIDDRGEMTVPTIGAVVRRMKRSHGIKLVIIDYLQLMIPDERGRTREDEVSQISRRLKRLAKSVELPIIVLAQLNREVEKRENKRPRLSDLRESGAIEQDADQVWFVHRPEYYDPEERPGMAEVLVAKNRNGPITTPRDQIWLHFLAETMSFRDALDVAGHPVPLPGTGDF